MTRERYSKNLLRGVVHSKKAGSVLCKVFPILLGTMPLLGSTTTLPSMTAGRKRVPPRGPVYVDAGSCVGTGALWQVWLQRLPKALDPLHPLLRRYAAHGPPEGHP